MCDTGTHILFYLECSTRCHKLDKLSRKEFFRQPHMISIFQAKYVQCVIVPIPPHAKSGFHIPSHLHPYNYIYNDFPSYLKRANATIDIRNIT